MDSNPLDTLINGAIHYEIELNKNPYITLETIILRLYKKIAYQTRVQPFQNEKTILFEKWHNEILKTFETVRSNLNHDDRACIERILSKDTPLTPDLVKFAICWYKIDATMACRLFAVDGLLGAHPKNYVQDAFSTQFQNHNEAIRTLYMYEQNPEKIKQVVEQVFLRIEDEDYELNSSTDSDIETYIDMYSKLVSEEEIKRVAKDREQRTQPPQPNKRKKTDESSIFKEWYKEISETFESVRSNLPHDERACVERILSNDKPINSDLVKFANCWYKINPTMACKLFAVDGLLGVHPKNYVQDAFSTQFQKHNEAIRTIYIYEPNPKKIKEIVEQAFNNDNEDDELDPDIEKYVRLYKNIVSKEEMTLVAKNRKNQTSSPQPNKRKKSNNSN